MAELLTIASVDIEKSIRCQAPGCGHRVYRKIHAVQDGEKIILLGQTCYGRMYKKEEPRYGEYGGGYGKPLTNEERELLFQNTEKFIELIKNRFEKYGCDLIAGENDFLVDALSKKYNVPPKSITILSGKQFPIERLNAIDAEAKENLAKGYKINAAEIGWKSLLLSEVERLINAEIVAAD
jgi:hypothetical protein